MLTIPPFLEMRRHQPVVRMLSEQKLARVHDVGERVVRWPDFLCARYFYQTPFE